MRLLLIIVLGCMVLSGCTRVEVIKPDGCKVTVLTLGSADVSDMTYTRDPNGITLHIGEGASSPTGLAEVTDSVGSVVGTAVTGL